MLKLEVGSEMLSSSYSHDQLHQITVAALLTMSTAVGTCELKVTETQKYLVQEQLSGCEKKSLLGAGRVSIESTCWNHLKG